MCVVLYVYSFLPLRDVRAILLSCPGEILYSPCRSVLAGKFRWYSHVFVFTTYNNILYAGTGVLKSAKKPRHVSYKIC